MLPWQWILMAAVAAALVILGVLVLAAVAASRSRPRPEQLTPTQRTQNPYRRFSGGRNEARRSLLSCSLDKKAWLRPLFIGLQ